MAARATDGHDGAKRRCWRCAPDATCCSIRASSSAALDALETALDDGTLDPERVKHSVRRRLKWAQWASPPNDWRRPSGADTAWGALLADKVLRIEHGPMPAMGTVTEVAIVDDDEEVHARRADRTGIVDAMRLGGQRCAHRRARRRWRAAGRS